MPTGTPKEAQAAWKARARGVEDLEVRSPIDASGHGKQQSRRDARRRPAGGDAHRSLEALVRANLRARNRPVRWARR